MTYLIKKIVGKTDWSSIPALFLDNILWTADAGVRAQGQLCYDRENLYVHMSAAEKEIRAVYDAPLSPVHEDSCLEFFFRFSDADPYFNFEINPNGCTCIQFGPGRGDRINIVRYDGRQYFDIHTERTAGGWEAFYRIPLKFLRLFYPHYEFKGELLANLYKCGDKTPREHYLSWSPVKLEEPDFHRPEFFGKMQFE